MNMLTNLIDKLSKLFLLLRDLLFWRALSTEIKRMKIFKDSCTVDDCYIFLPGKSVNDVHLEDFKDKQTFACNEIARHKDFSLLNLKYYMDIEPFTSLLKNKKLEPFYINMLNTLEKKATNRSMLCFFNYSSKRYIEKNNLLKDFKKYYSIHRRVFKKIDTSIDLEKPNSLMNGVVYFMLSLALYMGFKKIYLIGAGYTYSPYQWFHFYSNESEDTKGISIDYNKQPEEMHKHILKLSHKYNAEIFNVLPESYTSPIYTGIKLNDFKAILKDSKEKCND